MAQQEEVGFLWSFPVRVRLEEEAEETNIVLEEGKEDKSFW